ncbi:MAG: EamA family transporter, partial [Planctomycetia bacterium]|nr:EamA family transporter [Planctomycetia bacterium]
RGVLLAFWRALFAGLLLLPLVRRPRWDAKLVPLSLVFAAMNVSYLSAMTLTTAANAIWLQSTAPWWVCLIGAVFLREPFSRLERLPLVLGGIGLAIILWFEVQGQAQAGVICGLASGMSYALVVLFLRALRGQDSVWLVTVTHLATAAVIFPYVAYLNEWPSVAHPRAEINHLARSHRHRTVGTAAAAGLGVPGLVRDPGDLDANRRRTDPGRADFAVRRAADAKRRSSR